MFLCIMQTSVCWLQWDFVDWKAFAVYHSVLLYVNMFLVWVYPVGPGVPANATYNNRLSAYPQELQPTVSIYTLKHLHVSKHFTYLNISQIPSIIHAMDSRHTLQNLHRANIPHLPSFSHPWTHIPKIFKEIMHIHKFYTYMRDYA